MPKPRGKIDFFHPTKVLAFFSTYVASLSCLYRLRNGIRLREGFSEQVIWLGFFANIGLRYQWNNNLRSCQTICILALSSNIQRLCALYLALRAKLVRDQRLGLEMRAFGHSIENFVEQ